MERRFRAGPRPSRGGALLVGWTTLALLIPSACGHSPSAHGVARPVEVVGVASRTTAAAPPREESSKQDALPPTVVVTEYEDGGVPSWFWLSPTSKIRTAVPIPPGQEVEERISTHLHACAPDERVLLGSPYGLRFHGPEAIEDVAWGGEGLLYGADLAPSGRYLSVLRSEDDGAVLRVVELTGEGRATGGTEVALPDGCISPEHGWHHREPWVWVMCAHQGRVLTMNAEAKTHQVATVAANSRVLGWRGSPPALVVAVGTSRTNGGDTAPSVMQLTPSGAKELWAGMGALLLPQRELLFVDRAAHGDWTMVDLAAAASSPWPRGASPEPRSIAASSHDGRWVALLEGASDHRGPDLRLVEVETGASLIVAEGAAGRRITTVEFCPPVRP